MSIVVGTPGGAYGPTEAISDIITFANDPRVRDVAFTIGRGIKRGYQKFKEYRSRPRKRPAVSKMSRPRGAGASGIWHGRFAGSLKAPQSCSYYTGYSEKSMYADNTSQPMVNYIGFTSVPLNSTGGAVGATFTLPKWDGTQTGNLPMCPTRVLDDICMAVVRKFFKKYHPGRIDIESDQWTWGLYMNRYGITDDTLFSVVDREMLCILFDYPDSTSTTYVRSELQLSNTLTLRDIGQWMAGQIWKNFYDSGMIPYELGCLVGFAADTGNIKNPMTTKATMRLNGLVVRANVKTVVKLQNTTTAEPILDAEVPSTSITSISANPIRGRLYYFKGMSPCIRTGYLETVTGSNAYDEWMAANYKWPNKGLTPASGYYAASVVNPLVNVISTNDQPTGCWKAIPADGYFRNLVGSKVIELEPGVQKYEVVKFKYSGSLVGLLRKFSWYGVNSGPDARNDAYYQYKLGNCLMFAFEKRIRADGSSADSTNVSLAYQVDTSISCDCTVTSALLAKHIESYPTN